jgi:hypothetical protein
MLACRSETQKPRPAFSFQNAEQGFFEQKFQTVSFETSRSYGFVGVVVAAGVAAGAAAAGAAVPPSFGVAR